MPLFQVDGWDIKSDKVAFFDVSAKKADEKKKERKAKKDKIKKEQQAKKQRAIEDEIEGVESDEDVEDVADVESLEKVKDEAKEEKVKKQKKRQLSDSDKPEKKPKVSETVNTSQKTLTPLQQKMMAKLTGSRFRWINEQLYTITSDKALELMKEQPQLFDEYHDGFRSQVTSWPENPVDVFVDQIQQRSKKPVNAPGGLPGLQDSKKLS